MAKDDKRQQATEPNTTVKEAKIKTTPKKQAAKAENGEATDTKVKAKTDNKVPARRPGASLLKKSAVKKATNAERSADAGSGAAEKKPSLKKITRTSREDAEAMKESVAENQAKAAEQEKAASVPDAAKQPADAVEKKQTEEPISSDKHVEKKEQKEKAEKKAPAKETTSKAEKSAEQKRTAAKGAAGKGAAKPAGKVKNKELNRPKRQTIKIIKTAEQQRAEKAEQERIKAEKAEKERKEKEKNRAERGGRGGDMPKAGDRKRSSGGSAPKKHSDKEKERDKFNKLEKNRQSKKDLKSLEKKARKKHVKQKPEPEPEVEAEPLPVGTSVVDVPITIAGFCEQVGVTVPSVIMALLKLGIVANQNQTIDELTVEMIVEEMGINVVIGKVEEEQEEEGLELEDDRESDLKPRPPIITVMGHVDHGKTSLLDAIRKTNVTAQESGGITQHIGASEVEINGQKIVFLDTPGHEAFTAMRARGADITDIAVLVVAADDSVKPQTIESISHAKAAGVPIIVAINKMDKPGANPDIVKKDLADHGVLVEDWGGDVISVPVSAKTGDGIVNLLEMILLQAEVLELKANPDRLAMGTVLEARLDKAKGPVASLLVTNGTLKAGQSVVAGTCAGRIRLMTNHKGETIRKAGPATAVEILGLTDVPSAGDRFNAVGEDKKAKEIAERRKQKQREEVLARTSGSTLEELFSNIQEGEVKELNLIVKADVQGSVGAIITSLEKLSNDDVKVKVIHSGVGTVTESDVTLAGTSGAVIIGFNIRPTAAVSALADRESVQIRTYRVIYDILDDVESAMKGMLDPEFKEEILGECEVRETFKVPNVGIIAGAYVTDGKMQRNAEVRLIRDGIVIHEGMISSLKRFKDDAREVDKGFECGIGIENYNDIKVGDRIECFHMVEVERE